MSNPGPIVASLQAFRTHLSRCAAFQEWPDPNSPLTETQAAERIFIDALPRPTEGSQHTLAELVDLRPFAIIWMQENDGLDMRSDSTYTHSPIISGNLVARLEMNVPDDLADDPAALALSAAETIGRILRSGDSGSPGLWDLNAQPEHLPLVSIAISGPVRTHEDDVNEIGDALAWELDITFGAP